MEEKNIKIEAYMELADKLKEQFEAAYRPAFYKTLENQINAVLKGLVGEQG